VSKRDDGLHAYKPWHIHTQTKRHLLVVIVVDVDVDSPIKVGGGRSRWPVSSGAALVRASASAESKELNWVYMKSTHPHRSRGPTMEQHRVSGVFEWE